jgi:alpha-galactosidase
MFFGRDTFKYVLIGAGSSVFTMRLAGDILSEAALRGGEIALVDIDAAALGQAQAGVEMLVRSSGKPYTVTTHTRFESALPGADFVFLTYAIGGYAAWKQDIATATRFGVNQSVGDTIGPGAVIRILRTIPFTMQVVHEMERVCPNAYAINYVNPEGAQCLTIQKHSCIRAFGLCHGTPDTARVLAVNVFQVDPSRFGYEAAGVNHLTWFTRMTVDGRDVYPDLREALLTSGYARREPISFALLDIFARYPAPGDRHVSEFFSAFLKENVLQARDYTWKNNDFVVVDRWRAEGEARLQSALRGDGLAHFLAGSGETATHFIRALATGEVAHEMVNMLNQGFIENLSNGIIVELPAYVDSFGLKPQHMGSLPAGIAAKCEALGREYDLLVEAALHADKRLARQAMYLDPLCANCDDPDGLLDQMIADNLPLLPDGWLSGI